VAIGFTAVSGYSFLPRIVARARASLPHFELELFEMVTSDQFEALMTGQIDIAFVRPPVEQTSFESRFILREPLMAALPKTHPLAKRTEIAWRELQKETVLVLPESNCLSRQIARWCATHRLKQQRVEALQLVTLLAMVSAGGGISLVPKLAKNILDEKTGCVFLPFKGVEPKREINLLRNAQHYQSRAAMAVAEVGREVLCEAIRGKK